MACAGLGVAADARLALRLDEAADAGNYEYAVLLGFLDCGFRKQVQEGRGLLVGQFELLSHLPREGGLGQVQLPCIFLLLGALSGQPGVAWVSAAPKDLPRGRSPGRNRMEGVWPEAT